MMKNSYIEELKRTFPGIELPLTEAQLQQIEAAVNTPTQTRYIPKSERLTELEKELKMAEELGENLRKIMGIDPKHANTCEMKILTRNATFCFDHLPYTEYVTDGTKAKIEGHVNRVNSLVSEYMTRVFSVFNNAHTTIQNETVRIRREHKIEDKGAGGEALVKEHLFKSLKGTVLSGVVLPSAEAGSDAPKTAETDLLIVAEQGVFVCEVKNYGRDGQILDVHPDGQIIKRAPDGYALETLPSPFTQNERHCSAVRATLREVGMGDAPVYPAVIIANPNVTIRNKYGFHISDANSFCHDVRNMCGDSLSESQQATIRTIIQKRRLSEREFKFVSISPIYDVFSSALPDLSDLLIKCHVWRGAIFKARDETVKQVREAWERKYPACMWYERVKESLHSGKSRSITIWSIIAMAILLVIGKKCDAHWATYPWSFPFFYPILLSFACLIYHCFSQVHIVHSAQISWVGAIFRLCRKVVLRIVFFFLLSVMINFLRGAL